MSNQSFADLGVSRAVIGSLSTQGITHPFAIQRDVIADVLAGRDVLAKSPTGSGKTLAFGIPIVERIEADGPRPSALVLAPTRELATQIVEDIRDIAHARAAAGHGRLRRRRPRQAGQGRGALARARRDPGAARGPARAGRVHARRDHDAGPRRGRPDARHGLPPGGRPDRRRSAPPIARRCSSRRPSTARPAVIAREYTRDAAVHERGPAQRRASADVEHRFVAVEHLAPARGAGRGARAASAS